MLQFLGRLHILALHLPIGILVLAFLLEVAARKSAPSLRPAISFALFWGMLSAIVAAALGYLLSLDGSYDLALLNWHKWLGIGTACSATLLYFLHKKSEHSPVYLPVFIVTLLLMVGTGHYGGSLTHGSGFLLSGEKLAANQPLALSIADSTDVFTGVVLPVLKDKCGNCHNPNKRKGKLVVLTKEDLLKGGENGPVIVPGNLDASSLLKSIHLAIEAKEHMPPKGKKQLSDAEIQLLDWWVKVGAPFDKTVAAAAMPAALRSTLQTTATEKLGLLDGLQLEPVDEGELKKMRGKGVQVFPLALGSPLLMANFQGKKDLNLEQLRLLKPVAKNVVQVNFAGSNLDDAMLAIAKELPNLNKLHLEQTAITDQGLSSLAGLQYLEYLNLYQTKVTDAGLQHLKSLPNLRSVYLWQTAVTADGLAKFALQTPGIVFDRGVENDSIFGQLALKAPAIKATKELFTDTVQVTLEAGFAKVKIHYTTDGKEPDSTSAVYKSPLILSASTEVKAIAYLEGWTTSPVASKRFVQARYQPASIQLAENPDPRYKGEGGKTLIDFQRGGDSFRTGKWYGWQGHHCIATLDLGKLSEVSKVTAGCFEDTGAWVFFPKGLRVSTSADGKLFEPTKEASFPVATQNTKPSAKLFSVGFEKTQARFLKVEVLSAMKNPAWHPNKGEPCWVFVDEILVE